MKNGMSKKNGHLVGFAIGNDRSSPYRPVQGETHQTLGNIHQESASKDIYLAQYEEKRLQLGGDFVISTFLYAVVNLAGSPGNHGDLLSTTIISTRLRELPLTLILFSNPIDNRDANCHSAKPTQSVLNIPVFSKNQHTYKKQHFDQPQLFPVVTLIWFSNFI